MSRGAPTGPASVAACFVARNEAARIGDGVTQLLPLVDAGELAVLAVVDGASTDATAEIAERLGAAVLQAEAIQPDMGPLLGKGDSVWRAATVLDADVLVFLDADIRGDLPAIVRRLVAPLQADADTVFVKGHFRRADPDRPGVIEGSATTSGGRVSELIARPLIELIAPGLAHFHEPLGGQIAIRRAVLSSLPVVTGYGLEIGMLYDIAARHGADRIVEVDLGLIENPQRSVAQLTAMATEIATTLLGRVAHERAGAVPADLLERVGAAALPERPPLAPVAG